MLRNFVCYFYEDFLYMNSFMTETRLPRKSFEEVVHKYEHIRPERRSVFLQHRKELIIPELREYSPVPNLKERSVLLQIGPGLTMSLAMLGVAGINVYNNYLNGQPFLNSLIYILMPVTMLLSGILWPLLSRASERKAKRKEENELRNGYLEYLRDYEKKTEEIIDDHLKQELSFYFDGALDQAKLFNISRQSERFLEISVGMVTERRGLEFKDPNDPVIRERLERLQKRLHNIDDCPRFLDLKRYRAVSICSYRSQKEYMLKKVMLELSYKHYCDDLYLALYSEDLNPFSELFGLPQLIFGNIRLTLNKKSELQELDSMKLDRPLILLAYDHIDTVFSNRDIKVVYFSSDIKDVYVGSEALIDYRDEEGWICEEDRVPFRFRKGDADLKETAVLLGMYQKVRFTDTDPGFGDIFEGYSIKDLYLSKQTGLRADFAFIGKEPLSFDLHESKQGPHGLIGGSTGSGKSELIVSLLLSLCVRYRPDYLGMIIIDYKGGGIRESLSYKGRSLPHIVASIDNLEPDTFERLILAIDSECKRRQKLFRELSNRAMTSISDIDDYLENSYEEHGLPRIAHLLIVVDEFAELKKNDPAVIKELVSFSRIGRSLGLHLILATQRPSGVIDDEIWSNSHFKIALKVLSDKDSNDIIKTKDAAYLNDPGEFCLAVDDSLIRAKAVYSKKDHNNADPYEVSLLDNRLGIIRKKSIRTGKTLNEASYLVGKIIAVTEELGIRSMKLDFKRPSVKTRKEMVQKYGETTEAIIGEADDYLNARRSLLCFPMNENVFICSSRPKEINGILNNINRACVVIASKRYRNAHISDSLTYDDGEDIEYFFNKHLHENVDLTLVIGDLSCLLSYNDTYAAQIYQLLRRRSLTSVNVIAISGQSGIPFKLLNCFRYKYVIEAYDDQDVINVFSSRSQYSGRSFYYDEKVISFIPCLEEEFVEEESLCKPYIEHVPDRIRAIRYGDRILIGYTLKERKPVFLKKRERLLISSSDPDILEKVCKCYNGLPNIEISLYDFKEKGKEFEHVLWVGEGLYSQRLFYVDDKEELKDDEGYYYDGHKGHTIRIATYE